jgi:NAD+ kinase
VARVGFILKAESRDARAVLDTLAPRLKSDGHEPIYNQEDAPTQKDGKVVPEAELHRHIDVAVVLGGDGTMLRAAGLVADAGIPVLGINLGRLGFLSPFAPESAPDALREALAGKLKTSQRMRLAIQIVRERGAPENQVALNDAVVHQGAMARLIELSARINGQFVANYRADGLIIATPTGSTAYNLAAGGPIVAPSHQAMVLTPICAHSLTNRPLVIDAQCTVSLATGAESEQVVITADGRWARPVGPKDRIDIKPAPKPLVIFDSEKSYFDILREKLHWGRVPVETR